MTRIVFDIGGTNTRIARVEGDALMAQARHATPQDAEEAMQSLIAGIETVAEGCAITDIVGGVAGILDGSGGVLCAPNLPAWNGESLVYPLLQKFRVPVRVDNDADMAALGEALYGAAQGYGIVAYIGLGTGVGGSRVVRGRLDARGKMGLETGHQVIDARTGATLESLVGGAALQKEFGMPPKELPEHVWRERTPILAAGIWNAIVHWSPEIVVLGGSLIRGGNAFDIDALATKIAALQFSFVPLPSIVLAALGDDSGLHGARLWHSGDPSDPTAHMWCP